MCFCFELTRNVHFNQNMDNIFLSQGQLEGLSFDKFLLNCIQTVCMLQTFFGIFILAFIARFFSGNRLKWDVWASL